MAKRFEYYNIGDNNFKVVGVTTPNVQTFTPLVTHDIEYVKVLIYRDAEFAYDRLNARIEHCDEDGKPNGHLMCSGTIYISGDNLTTDTAGEWKTIVLDEVQNDMHLEAGTTYALVLKQAGGG